jgi:hypothetical protein
MFWISWFYSVLGEIWDNAFYEMDRFTSNAPSYTRKTKQEKGEEASRRFTGPIGDLGATGDD